MRFMVVVSGDYGELGAALYFLRGLPPEPRPVLALPPSLLGAADDTPGVDVQSFANIRALTALVRQARPDVVMLASGYLLAISSVFTFLDAVRFLRFLRGRGANVITTDPFLGAVRGPRDLDFRTLAERRGERRSLLVTLGRRGFYAAVAAVMYLHLSAVARLLRSAWHVYPVPSHRVRPRPGVRSLCYCYAVAVPAAPAGASGRGTRPVWLFVLSMVDYRMHAADRGAAFVEDVARRLGEAVALGRDVEVIGPEAFIEALQPLVAGQPRIAARSDASHARYMASLVGAEYAFFWNYYSFSVLHRVLAGLPVFFFDAGHLIHILPSIEAEGIRVFYDGWRPPLLAVGAALDEAQLAELASETAGRFARIAEGLRRCPSPGELLRTVAP